MRPVKLSCGCTHNVAHWLVPCAPCEAIYREAHRNAGETHASDMRARDPEYVYTPQCPNQEALS